MSAWKYAANKGGAKIGVTFSIRHKANHAAEAVPDDGSPGRSSSLSNFAYAGRPNACQCSISDSTVDLAVISASTATGCPQCPMQADPGQHIYRTTTAEGQVFANHVKAVQFKALNSADIH